MSPRPLLTTLLFFVLSATQASTADALPIANAKQFSNGNYWVWNYYENGDRTKLHASEKYSVANVSGDLLTFEIWTKYSGKSDYTPSAKFIVNLDDCRRAFSGPRKREFTINMYAFAGGKWSTEAYQVKSTAFEEKFNCNPNEYSANHPQYATDYDIEATPWGTERLFQQKAKASDQILSFYFADHRLLAGVAYKKEFNPQSPFEYEMELVEAK